MKRKFSTDIAYGSVRCAIVIGETVTIWALHMARVIVCNSCRCKFSVFGGSLASWSVPLAGGLAAGCFANLSKLADNGWHCGCSAYRQTDDSSR